MADNEAISRGAARHEIWQHEVEASDADEAEELIYNEYLGMDSTGPDGETPEAWSILTVEEIEPGTFSVTTVSFWRTEQDPS